MLVGPPGAGKSTVGRLVAQTLGVQFHDFDDDIDREHGMPAGSGWSRSAGSVSRNWSWRSSPRSSRSAPASWPSAAAPPTAPGVADLLTPYHIVYLKVDIDTLLKREGLEQDDQEFEPVDAGELPFDLRLVGTPPEQDYQVQQVEDTPDELLAFAALRKHLPGNPRELKRLVNVHRLVRLLARHGGRRPGPVERRLIVGWLLFCFARPAAAEQVVSTARASTDPTTEVTHDELAPFLLPGDDGAGTPKLTSADLAPGTPLGEAWEITALFRRRTAQPPASTARNLSEQPSQPVAR
jgi:hypothetical protein